MKKINESNEIKGKNENLVKLAKMGALGISAALVLSSCAAAESGASLVGAGASSQGEAQNAWIASYIDEAPDVQVNYDPAGSGAGRENFQQGASLFAGSDRAFSLEEIASEEFSTCKPESNIVQLPIYISPIAVVFNLEGVTELNLDAVTIAKIFTGEIENWNDPQIASQNSEVSLPDLRITPVHRADKSGTTGNFTDYLAEAAGSDWEFGSVEEWPASLSGEAAPQTSGVVSAVTGGLGTIGYVDASRAGDLGKVSVKVGNSYTEYSPESAAAVLDVSEFEGGRSSGDLAIGLERSPDAEGVYPIVLVSYLIACESYADPAAGGLVANYLSFIASEEGQSLAAEHTGSAPMSTNLRERVDAAIALIN